MTFTFTYQDRADRVIQAPTLLVAFDIVNADLPPNFHGWYPGREAGTFRAMTGAWD